MSLQVVDVRCVWWDGYHNAFTDITEFNGRYYCTFRHSTAHAGEPGDVYVLASDNLEDWALVTTLSASEDDRDPKFFRFDDRLGVVFYGIPDVSKTPSGVTYVCYSEDGSTYSEPQPIGPENLWFWKIRPFQGRLYATAYSYPTPKSDWGSYLYVSEDGVRFSKVSTIVQGQCANESHALFKEEGTCYVIVRRETDEITPLLAVARPPYTEWETHELDLKLQGPHIFEFKGQVYLAGRFFPPELLPRTGVASLDLETMEVGEPLIIKSLGWDTSYPGTLVEGDTLYMSYYSRHDLEEKGSKVGDKATGIYLAVMEG